METYPEYPIRCETCNEQIAAFAADFEAMVEAGSTVEEALNELGITLECSRIALMNPTHVAFNMENREVIEGFKSVDAATDIDAQNQSTSRPIFNQCIGAQNAVGPGVQQAPLVIGTQQPTINVLQPRVQAAPVRPIQAPQLRVATAGMQQRPPTTLTGLQTINLVQPTARVLPTLRTQAPATQVTTTTSPVIQQILSPEAIAQIIPGLGEIEALGVGIPVKDIDTIDVTRFQEPVMVGVPTINPNPAMPQLRVYVGAGKHVNVLGGRTYLAQ